jgi:uncharacterized protein YjbI with pentapeptide repeats
VNRKAYVLILIFLAAIFGWGLGYIRLPYIEKEYSFGVGVLTTLAIISLTTLLTYLLKTKKSISSSKSSKKLFWLILTCVTTGAICIFLYQKNYTQQNKIETQSNLIVAQSETITALEQGNLMALVATVLAAADTELAQSSNRSLSQAIIDRIADLSHSLKPYRQVTKDSIATQELSRERGQLLLSLTKMNIDSASFAQIKKIATFEYADLRDAHLANMDLSGINLARANLKGATLLGSSLEYANLEEANLKRSQLSSSSLKNAKLKLINLDWANLSQVNISEVRLVGASLKSANLIGADFTGTYISYTNFRGANLIKANFTNTHIDIVDFSQANLTEAILDNLIIKRVNFTNVNFEKTIVNKDWFSNLKKEETVGLEKLKSDYEVASIEDNKDHLTSFLLEIKKK